VNRGAPARRAILLAAVALAGGPSIARAATLSIRVVGNHLVNGVGQHVRLLGVDREGSEYACHDGFAYSSGPIDAGDAAAIAAWGADAVRVPLNEDCWLGINGEPAYGTSSGYQAAIEAYVTDLNADGIYAILDLHWSAPGSTQSGGQYPMPDANSVAFWTNVASTFKANHAVVFDAFNEPYSPAYDGWPSQYTVSWSCWENGGCTVPNAVDGTAPYSDPPTYTAVGMQTLVNAIRAAGATQPIMLGGLAYANDLTGWLANEPSDPHHQLVASFHNYNGEDCDDAACWNAQVAPVAAAVPVVTGEFDEDDCPAGGGTQVDNFDNAYMDWADAHGVSYLAWGWLVPDPLSCSSLTLLSAYPGTPAQPNGVALRDHLRALVSAQLNRLLKALVDRHERLTDAAVRGGIALRLVAPEAGILRVRLFERAGTLASGSRTYRGAAAGTLTLRATRLGLQASRRRDRVSVTIIAGYVTVAGLRGSARAVASISPAS
jgi:hypothetical protein